MQTFDDVETDKANNGVTSDILFSFSKNELPVRKECKYLFPGVREFREIIPALC